MSILNNHKASPQCALNTSGYIGRFAPSPSGPLHFGSLTTAVGSYIQAKFNVGKWLLRIEDIDPPRQVPGATYDILTCLEAHNLCWDDDVVYQSQRSELYLSKIDVLKEQGYTYNCRCTRTQLSILTSNQLCSCAELTIVDIHSAIRFKHTAPILQFNDQLLGDVVLKENDSAAQFVIRRKDGLFAYQLAVVVDDIEQGITEVARGADLLSATAYQLALYRAFHHRAPKYLHFPVVVTQPGKKLSKQNHAPAIDNAKASRNLIDALSFLGLPMTTELQHESCENILTWAVEHWDLSQLASKRECIDNRIGVPDSI